MSLLLKLKKHIEYLVHFLHGNIVIEKTMKTAFVCHKECQCHISLIVGVSEPMDRARA
jgi:hypothetical protein